MKKNFAFDAFKFDYGKKIMNRIPMDFVKLEIKNNDTLKPVILKDDKFYLVNDQNEPVEHLPLYTYQELYITMAPIETGTYSLSTGDIDILESSFCTELLAPGNEQLVLLLQYFSESWNTFNLASKFYAPYITVSQSSGVGKSRLILECGSYLPIVYGVFRASSDKSYPPMSPWISQFYEYITSTPVDGDITILEDTDSNSNSSSSEIRLSDKDIMRSKASTTRVGRVLVFIEALLKAYTDMYNFRISLPEYENNPFKVFEVLSAYFATEKGQDSFLSFISYTENDARSIGVITESILSLTQYFSEISKTLNYPFALNNTKILPFLLVLDEVSLLLEFKSDPNVNPLYVIRRALHLLSKRTVILCIAIGTNSDVSSYNRAVNDDSLRYVERKYLLPPFIMSRNWDIFRNELELDEFIVNCDNMKSSKVMNLLATFGRALWSSLSLDSLFAVSASKLKNGGGSKIYEAAMAIWSIRTGLSLNSDLILAKTMLRSHMAVLLSISYDAKALYVGYPSEPILALTAREILRGVADFNLKAFFSSLLEYVQGRPIDQGEIVETVLEQICLIAMDKSKNLCVNGAEVTGIRDDFLERLLNVDHYILEIEEKKSYECINFYDKSESEALIQQGGPTTSTAVHEQDVEMVSVENVQLPDTRSLNPFYSRYHITNVEGFFKEMFGEVKYNLIHSHLPQGICSGLVNFTHVTRLARNFPFDEMFSTKATTTTTSIQDDLAIDSGEIPLASDFKGCNIIDKALLRVGILRQTAFRMPPSYFGIDLIIPVLIPSTSVPGRTESEDLFTFIAVQFKSTYEKAEIVKDKMDANKHYVPCPKHAERQLCSSTGCQLRTSQTDLDFIYRNQVSIYMSSEKDLKPKAAESESEKSNKRQASREIAEIENFEICQTDDHVCIVTRSVSQLAVLTENVLETVDQLLNYRHNPFESAEDYSKQMTADAAINLISINYTNVDRILRASRKFSPLPNLFQNIEGFNQFNISSAIDSTKRKNTPNYHFKEIAKFKKIKK